MYENLWLSTIWLTWAQIPNPTKFREIMESPNWDREVAIFGPSNSQNLTGRTSNRSQKGSDR